MCLGKSDERFIRSVFGSPHTPPKNYHYWRSGKSICSTFDRADVRPCEYAQIRRRDERIKPTDFTSDIHIFSETSI